MKCTVKGTLISPRYWTGFPYLQLTQTYLCLCIFDSTSSVWHQNFFWFLPFQSEQPQQLLIKEETKNLMMCMYHNHMHYVVKWWSHVCDDMLRPGHLYNFWHSIPNNFFTRSWGSNSRVDFDLADLKKRCPLISSSVKRESMRFSAYLSGVAPVSSWKSTPPSLK